MGLDYFPRLAAISQDNVKVKEMVNQQIEVVLFLMAPFVLLSDFISPIGYRSTVNEGIYGHYFFD